MTTLTSRRIAITGLTGQVGGHVARALAADNEVIGLARFGDDAVRAELEGLGIDCHRLDLVAPDFGAIPSEVDHVLHFAVAKSGRWDIDLAATAEAVGHLMAHFRSAGSFLHCSSTAVYRPNGGAPAAEGDPLGDHHRDLLPTYSIAKIAGEAVARFGARHFELPTTIARLNVPYGDEGGWPLFHLLMLEAGVPVEVHEDGSRYNPIHHDDLVRHLPSLLDAAAVPATTVNWGGEEEVAVEEWVAHLASLTGLGATTECSPTALPSAVVDLERQHTLLPPAEVGWRDGFRRMVEASRPDLIDGSGPAPTPT